MIGQDDVLVPEASGRARHDLDAVDAIGPVRVGVRVAADVGGGDQVRQRPGQRGLDLAVALPNLRRDPGKAEPLVHIGLLRIEQQLAGLDDLEALLRQRPAAVQGHAAQRDVVLLAAGEVDEVRAPRLRRANHQVDARAVGHQDARLVGAGRDDLVDLAQLVERGDHRRWVVDRGEQVEVADRRPPSAERAGHLDAPDAACLAEALDQPGHKRVGVMNQHPVVDASHPRDAVEDVRLGPLRQPLDLPQASFLRRRAQRLHGIDAQLHLEQADGLRTDAGDSEDLQQAVGDLRAQPLVVLEPAGLGQLGELGRQCGARAGDLRRLAASIERCHVVRVALDDIGDPTVGNRLVDHLAQDLEHVADLVEDPRELGVADDRVVSARHAPWSRHCRPFYGRSAAGPVRAG